MTSSPLVGLVSHCITTLHRVHDYWQLTFDNGDVLHIYNANSLEMTEETKLRTLVGRPVLAVSETSAEIRLELDILPIRIDLSESAFRGPEALLYLPKSGLHVVWS
jgi:hypothetical protein